MTDECERTPTDTFKLFQQQRVQAEIERLLRERKQPSPLTDGVHAEWRAALADAGVLKRWG